MNRKLLRLLSAFDNRFFFNGQPTYRNVSGAYFEAFQICISTYGLINGACIIECGVLELFLLIPLLSIGQ